MSGKVSRGPRVVSIIDGLALPERYLLNHSLRCFDEYGIESPFFEGTVHPPHASDRGPAVEVLSQIPRVFFKILFPSDTRANSA